MFKSDMLRLEQVLIIQVKSVFIGETMYVSFSTQITIKILQNLYLNTLSRDYHILSNVMKSPQKKILNGQKLRNGFIQKVHFLAQYQ